jgi:hypothetical protein
MQRTRSIALSIVAVLAVSAATTASIAQAAAPRESFSASLTPAFSSYPAFALCKKASPKNTGRFNDKNCSEENAESRGKYELVSAVGTKYTAKTGAVKLTTPAIGGEATCKKSKTAGVITSESEGTGTVTFTGCETLGKKCASPGQKAGIVVTPVLKSRLIIIEGKETAIGDTSFGEPPDSVLSLFECEGLHVTVKGSITGIVTGDIDSASKTATETVTSEDGGMESEIEGVGTFPTFAEAATTYKSVAAEILTN